MAAVDTAWTKCLGIGWMEKWLSGQERELQKLHLLLQGEIKKYIICQTRKDRGEEVTHSALCVGKAVYYFKTCIHLNLKKKILFF